MGIYKHLLSSSVHMKTPAMIFRHVGCLFPWLPAVFLLETEVVPDTLVNTDNMRTCPFPWPEDVDPCSCKVNEKFQVFLTCDLQQNMDTELLERLSTSFGCRREVFKFNINMNGYDWDDWELLGNFQLTYFNLVNFTLAGSYLHSGAFSGSATSLVGVNIAKKENVDTDYYQRIRIQNGAFSNLSSLTSISIGLDVLSIGKQAFYNLPSLKILDLKRSTINGISNEAFCNLPQLTDLDLSNLNLKYIGPDAFHNIPGMKELNLKGNDIRTIGEGIISGIPFFVNLDLSGSKKLTNIGTLLENLSPNISVNLRETDIKVLPKNSFKIFIENVINSNGLGTIEMPEQTLRCTCDIKWLLDSKIDITNVLRNMSCHDGRKLNQVDAEFLDKLCPAESCPGYDADSGRSKQLDKKNNYYYSVDE